MPSLQVIASQNISIIVSPRKMRRQDASPWPSAAAAAATKTDADDSVVVHGCRVSSPAPSVDQFMDPQVVVDIEAHQDAFDQFNALVERESHEAYSSIQNLPQSPDANNIVHEKLRYQACYWCYSIVDKYDVPRTTVSIAMSYFDKLVTSVGCVERSQWSLALVSCLYLAIKIHSYGGKVFDPDHLAKESKLNKNQKGSDSSNSGIVVTGKAILEMEDHICNVFDWYVNPPVAGMYVDILAPVLTEQAPLNEYDFDQDGNVDVDDKVRHHLVEEAKFLCERSVMDTFFTTKAPSSIACASVLVAMDLMRFPPGVSQYLVSLPLDHDPEETELCAQRLHQICTQEDHKPAVTVSSLGSTRGEAASRIRTVTPTKGDMPSGIKRMRQDTAIDAIYGEDDHQDEVTVSPQKKRRIY